MENENDSVVRAGVPGRMVLIDDDESVRAVASFFLRHLGWELETFASGLEALAWLETNACGGVITDLHLPDYDGVRLLQWIHCHRPETGVAVISGDGLLARHRLRQAGLPESLPVLAKPFSLAELEKVTLHFATESAVIGT